MAGKSGDKKSKYEDLNQKLLNGSNEYAALLDQMLKDYKH